VFDLAGPIEGILRQGLELEKGTFMLYGFLASSLQPGPVADIVGALAKAEVAHARAVYRLLPAQAPSVEFDELFDQLPGDLIESGQPFAAVVARARELEELGPPAMLELALEIELSAYDLYRALASTVADGDARGMLTDLAQQEKQHSASVLRALGAWAANKSP
jgi:rubrerythrin